MTKPAAYYRLFGSVSFNADEITALDEILTRVMRGGDCRVLSRSPAAARLRKRVETLKSALERQRTRRAERDTTPKENR